MFSHLINITIGIAEFKFHLVIQEDKCLTRASRLRLSRVLGGFLRGILTVHSLSEKHFYFTKISLSLSNYWKCLNVHSVRTNFCLNVHGVCTNLCLNVHTSCKFELPQHQLDELKPFKGCSGANLCEQCTLMIVIASGRHHLWLSPLLIVYMDGCFMQDCDLTVWRGLTRLLL